MIALPTSEWFGTAPFPSPRPAPLAVLRPLFPSIFLTSQPSAVPAPYGESLAELHTRCARALMTIVEGAGASGARDPQPKPEALVVCTHAAVVIALGRALTGQRRADEWVAGDFDTFTCGVSTFVRSGGEGSDGRGAAWVCAVNSGVEHLSGGGERNW